MKKHSVYTTGILELDDGKHREVITIPIIDFKVEHKGSDVELTLPVVVKNLPKTPFCLTLLYSTDPTQTMATGWTSIGYAKCNVIYLVKKVRKLKESTVFIGDDDICEIRKIMPER